ncbi:MAG: exodeoxyribonuclease V subunit alpha [Desulfobacterales bacterium]|jgi:exodeoxyribonuclease V alpha subunit|nr:exodeoxyribonuclease V subunit alpha [Desulfobacterales bacterium]
MGVINKGQSPSPFLEKLFRSGYFSALDYYFACTVGRLAEESDPMVLTAAALASRDTAQGHICVNVARLAGCPVFSETGEAMPGMLWPERSAWIVALAKSPLVARNEATAPLVMDSAGRLYLARYWDYQQRLIHQLRQRAAHGAINVNETLLSEGLNRFFSEKSTTEGMDRQRMAVEKSVRNRLTIVSGGPGTGKTTTVIRMLALIIDQALNRDGTLPRIRLAAPTGKAAARLSETIGAAKTRDNYLRNHYSPILEYITEKAETIHRLLGVRGKGTGRFHHTASRPLPADVLVIDESSMVDLPLMTRLIEAVPAKARLILLGDKDQLSSVEAGAILGDICQGVDLELHRPVAQTTAKASDMGNGISHCIIQLTHSYRFGFHSGIGRLSRAINRGDAEDALACLKDDACRDVSLIEAGSRNLLRQVLPVFIETHFMPLMKEQDPLARLLQFQTFRVLCAHRKGPAGVEAVNAAVREIIRRNLGAIRQPAANDEGHPIMVTQNDYQLGLFNGDIGIIGASPAEENQWGAFFQGAGQSLRYISLSKLPQYESVYAMSVHKSQGTEFDHVLLILPPRRSRIITRELLYTAITRARKSVVIFGEAPLVREAVQTPVQRASGIGDQLSQKTFGTGLSGDEEKAMKLPPGG